MRALVVLLMAASCGDNLVESPDAGPLPLCADVGCLQPDCTHEICACMPARNVDPIPCDPNVPSCSSIGCSPPSSPGSSCSTKTGLCTCPHPDGASPPLTCQK